jgi:hypothetical protein
MTSAALPSAARTLQPTTILHILSYLPPNEFSIPLHRYTHRMQLKKTNIIFTFFQANDNIAAMTNHAMKLFFGYFANDPERAIYTIVRNVTFDDRYTESIPENYLYLAQLFFPFFRLQSLDLKFKNTTQGRLFCQKYFENPFTKSLDSASNVLEYLIHLDLSQDNNLINDVILENLCVFHYPSLQCLNLSKSTVNLKHLNQILSRASNLKTLIVDHTNAFECVAISKLSITRGEFYHSVRTYNTKITTISANYCLMDDDCFISLIWHLPNVTSLSVHHNKITLLHHEIINYSPPSIVSKRQQHEQYVVEKTTISSPSLTHLDLSHNDIHGGKFMILAHPDAFPNLKSLSLNSCSLTETEVNRLMSQMQRIHKLKSLSLSGYDFEELPNAVTLMKSLTRLNIALVTDPEKIEIMNDTEESEEEIFERKQSTNTNIRPDQEWEYALSKNNNAGYLLVCLSPAKGLDRNRMHDYHNKSSTSPKRVKRLQRTQIPKRRQEAMKRVYSPNSPVFAFSTSLDSMLAQKTIPMRHLAIYSRNNIPLPVLEKRSYAPNSNILTSLRFSENLESLSLAHHRFTDQHLVKHIFSMNLTSLDLSYNCITGNGAQHIANNLTWLTELNLSHNKIKNKAGRAIFEMPNLKKLSMANTCIINETLYGLVHKIGDNPLEFLDISYNILSPKAFSCELVFRQLPCLTHLNASNSMFVNDYELIKNLASAKQLRFLDIRENKVLGDRGRRFLSRDIPQLRVLY